jgi:hypothetical protein
MAGSEASSRAVPSLFGEEQSFEVEVPPSPFADVRRATVSPRSRPTDAATRDASTRDAAERGPRSFTGELSPVAAAATAPPVRRPHPAAEPDPSLRSRIRPPTDQELNPRRMRDQIRRLIRLDESVFGELISDPSQNLAAVLIAAASILAAAIGGWLWLAIDAQGLSTGAIALREFFLGSLVLFVLWGAWLGLTRLILVRSFGHELETGALLRVMGFAALPLTAQLLMIVSPLSYGIGLLSLLAWFGASAVGLRAVVPAARARELLIANGLGFGLLVLAMSAIADATAIAPGVFAHGADLTKLI